MAKKIFTALGLMSGTSLDGIDAALIRTDGGGFVERMGFLSVPYAASLREDLRACLGRVDRQDGLVLQAERAMTLAHSAAVRGLLAQSGMAAEAVDLIGFHGQTIHHDPKRSVTIQIGDGALLAAETGIAVINDFRSADVAAGGQGAPLLPLYHAALANGLPRPVAILNLGGVGNVTFIGADDSILAFDTGPASALIDDWMRQKAQQDYDANGALAATGRVDPSMLQAYLSHPYFNAPPPKSLDRNQWTLDAVQGMSAADGAATLTAFTVQAVARALPHLPETPKAWYVTGGGRHNGTIMQGLRQAFNVTVAPVDALGWNGDAMEAEGFAYLAVRSALGLPLSLPGTTGVPHPISGGRRYDVRP